MNTASKRSFAYFFEVCGNWLLFETHWLQTRISYSNCCTIVSLTAVHVLDTGTKINLQQNIALDLGLLYLWLVGCHTQRCALLMKSLEPLMGNGKCWLVSNHCGGHGVFFNPKNVEFKRFLSFILTLFSWQGHLTSWLQPASSMTWKVWTNFLILIVRVREEHTDVLAHAAHLINIIRYREEHTGLKV